MSDDLYTPTNELRFEVRRQKNGTYPKNQPPKRILQQKWIYGGDESDYQWRDVPEVDE